MSDQIEIFDLIERLDAASRDDTLSDGMLYRAAAERLAEYNSWKAKHWQNIIKRTGEQDERIRELEDQLSDANDLIDTLGGCIDGYYVELGHSRISEHEDYRKKWGIKEQEDA